MATTIVPSIFYEALGDPPASRGIRLGPMIRGRVPATGGFVAGMLAIAAEARDTESAFRAVTNIVAKLAVRSPYPASVTNAEELTRIGTGLTEYEATAVSNGLEITSWIYHPKAHAIWSRVLGPEVAVVTNNVDPQTACGEAADAIDEILAEA